MSQDLSFQKRSRSERFFIHAANFFMASGRVWKLLFQSLPGQIRHCVKGADVVETIEAQQNCLGVVSGTIYLSHDEFVQVVGNPDDPIVDNPWLFATAMTTVAQGLITVAAHMGIPPQVLTGNLGGWYNNALALHYQGVKDGDPVEEELQILLDVAQEARDQFKPDPEDLDSMTDYEIASEVLEDEGFEEIAEGIFLLTSDDVDLNLLGDLFAEPDLGSAGDDDEEDDDEDEDEDDDQPEGELTHV